MLWQAGAARSPVAILVSQACTGLNIESFLTRRETFLDRSDRAEVPCGRGARAAGNNHSSREDSREGKGGRGV